MVVCGAPKFLVGSGVLLFALFLMVKSEEEPCNVEVEDTLRMLLTPQQHPSMQLQAIRKEILRKLQDALSKDDDLSYKRSLGSLAQWGNLPPKRSLEALARGGLIRTLPDQEEEPDEDDANDKRSLAALAKNGQLPGAESKRGIESLARNGELLHSRKDLQKLLEELYSKRSVSSLAKNYNFPNYGKRFVGSLARSGQLPYGVIGKRSIVDKRNVAALLRQDSYVNGKSGSDSQTKTPDFNAEEKRFPGKFKREVRKKRQLDYYEGSPELPEAVYQNQNVYDYEEFIKELTGSYPNTEKRFLGRLPQMGKPKTTVSPKARFL